MTTSRSRPRRRLLDDAIVSHLETEDDDEDEVGVTLMDDDDDGFGSCSHCGAAWFEVVNPPDAPADTPAHAGPAVCIDAHGNVTGYAGVLRCLECGAFWSHPDSQRPFLQVVRDDDGNDGDNDDDVGLQQQWWPPTTSSSTSDEVDTLLAEAFRALLHRGLQACSPSPSSSNT